MKESELYADKKGVYYNKYYFAQDFTNNHTKYYNTNSQNESDWNQNGAEMVVDGTIASGADPTYPGNFFFAVKNEKFEVDFSHVDVVNKDYISSFTIKNETNATMHSSISNQMKLGYINRTQLLIMEYFVFGVDSTGMDFNKVFILDLGVDFPRRIVDPTYRARWNLVGN